MKLIIEDAYDHYLEDPDNEERIKKAEQDVIKLADKPLPKVKPPKKEVDKKSKWKIYPNGGSQFYYLGHYNRGPLYFYEYDEAPEMTRDQALKAHARFEKNLNPANGPYEAND